MAKRKNVEVVTPIGTAQYPWLNGPDRKWDADGQYRTNLILEDNEETDAFMAMLEKEWEKAADHAKDERGKPNAKYADKPWVKEEDDEGGYSGRTILKAKLKAIVRPKAGTPWKKRPVLVDAKKKPMGENVGGGSQVRLKLGIRGWFVPTAGAGASLDLLACQVFELRSFNSATDGFDEVEDGFTSEVAAPAFDDKVEDSSDVGNTAGTF